MKYLVDIKDTSYATVEVDANSVEEAEEKAHAAYYHGCVEWQDCDLDIEARIKETIRNETKNVRELVLARAFSSTLISEECEENIDQLDNYELDEILEDWFDKYGKDKIN